MPAAAAAGGYAPAASPNNMGAGAQNPFWQASNLYAEKITTLNQTLTTGVTNTFQAVNPGNFLRGVRFLVRSSGGTGTPTADNPGVVINSLDLENVDGGEIMYPMGGYAYIQGSRYFRPWLLDPTTSYDYAQSANPSFSLFLQPEIRLTAGVLSNTDSRSLYKYNLFLAQATAVTSGTAPTIAVTSYVDAWGQPDPQDLEGTPNQPLPPGLALQTKRRHQAGVTLQGGGTNNIFQITSTGNALRGIVAVIRDNNGVRQDYLSDPIRWQQDNRNLGVFSPDMLFQWMSAQYSGFGLGARPVGVYVFPRFYNPGDLTGQGWLYTSNATKLTFEVSTAAAFTGGFTGTAEFITDEVYPVQSTVSPDLLEI
jgi:hypothetical protein